MEVVLWMFIIAVFVGGFTWIKPSKRDQRLASVRSRALSYGFRLGSVSVPDVSNEGRVAQLKQMVTLYHVTLAVVKESAPTFMVQRTSASAGIDLPHGWDWVQRMDLSAQQVDLFSCLLEQLPESIHVLMLNQQEVALSWDEFEDQVDLESLREHLKKLAHIFGRTVVELKAI